LQAHAGQSPDTLKICECSAVHDYLCALRNLVENKAKIV
jgi:hypothetical protein